MIKAVIATDAEKKDVMTCEDAFRKETIAITEKFSGQIYDIWGWTKSRMNLTLEEGITPTRHHGETKQRDYILSGAEGVWDASSQTLLSYVREHTPIVLEKVKDVTCPNPKCRVKLKIYSNKIRGVQEAWEKFWIAKKTLLEIENTARVEALTNLARNARKKFKLVPDRMKCYDNNLNLLPQFKKNVFLQELTTQYETILKDTSKEFIDAVIRGLPDFIDCNCKCGTCGVEIKIIDD